MISRELDRRGNRYLINFVDYSINYVRVFVAKIKIEATKNFKHFVLYFEKRFNCRIHVLRTGGGKDNVNVDPFCRSAGVRRQVSEASNQASNEKAEKNEQDDTHHGKMHPSRSRADSL